MERFILENSFWHFEIIESEDKTFLYRLFNKFTNSVYSDMDYNYDLFYTISKRKSDCRIQERKIKLIKNKKIIINIRFTSKEIELIHIFILEKNSKWLDEKIIINNLGYNSINLLKINLGFKKMLFYQHDGWSDNLDEFNLISIPTRRFHGIRIDRKLESFSANDLLISPWSWDKETTAKPDFFNEGWLWCNKKGGLLVCKYNQENIEFSRFSRFPILLEGRGVENVAIIFGGVETGEKQLELAKMLKPRESLEFGISRYVAYKGDFREGYDLYRQHLESKGHRIKRDYNPPVQWNELYNLGWFGESIPDPLRDPKKFKTYTLTELYSEAELAKDIGVECLYLDPGWDTFPGSTKWNEDRFGSLKKFSSNLKKKYGLKLGLHLMMNFYSDEEMEEFYSITKKGKRNKFDDFHLGLYYHCPNEIWINEKTKRLLQLAENGVDFMMFDFTELSDISCWGKDHRHEIPMYKITHARNIFRVIQNVKRSNPNVLIEAHDRITGGYTDGHPLYFQHGYSDSYDENWGFEFMWNALQDLISLKSVSLYEYNMAYSIPLYLHINEYSDNTNMLQFWWYASLSRHLGIGGLNDKYSEKYQALKNAMKLYMKLKKYFTVGIFYSIDPLIHLHFDKESKTSVVTAYNIKGKTKKTIINIDKGKYGLRVDVINAYDGIGRKLKNVKISNIKENILRLETNITPLSPIIFELK